MKLSINRVCPQQPTLCTVEIGLQASFRAPAPCASSSSLSRQGGRSRPSAQLYPLPLCWSPKTPGKSMMARASGKPAHGRWEPWIITTLLHYLASLSWLGRDKWSVSTGCAEAPSLYTPTAMYKILVKFLFFFLLIPHIPLYREQIQIIFLHSRAKKKKKKKSKKVKRQCPTLGVSEKLWEVNYVHLSPLCRCLSQHCL
jgi:hypothetical protein